MYLIFVHDVRIEMYQSTTGILKFDWWSMRSNTLPAMFIVQWKMDPKPRLDSLPLQQDHVPLRGLWEQGCVPKMVQNHTDKTIQDLRVGRQALPLSKRNIFPRPSHLVRGVGGLACSQLFQLCFLHRSAHTLRLKPVLKGTLGHQTRKISRGCW